MAQRGQLWTRLFWLFLLASAVPIVGAGILSASWLTRTAREDAQAQLSTLADLGGSLIRGLVVAANEKLSILSHSISEDLAARRVGAYSVANDAYRETVDQRLKSVIEPDNEFIDLHYYAAGKAPEFVARSSRGELQVAQRRAPDFETQQQVQIQNNLSTPLVNRPLNANRPFGAQRAEPNFGFPTLPLSVPVARGDETLGALVGYIDLRELPRVLEPIATAGCAVRITDGDGAELATAGAVADPAMSIERPVGYGDWSIAVRRDEQSVFVAASQVRSQVYLWTGIGIALAVLASLLISGWITRPVRVLTSAAQAVERGDLSARAGIDRADEVGRLGRAFDRMAAALEELDTAKSEFVGSVSHELRTPLTSIRLSLANVLDGLVGPVDDRVRPTIVRVRDDLDRLVRIVDDLLQLARLEAGVEVPQPAATDLLALARRCTANLEPLVARSDKAIRVAGAGTATVDPNMAYRILTNLCDNAIKYGTAEDTIVVTVAKGRFSVENGGDGLDPERHLERFAQGQQDGVRPSGVGMGLSIVHKLVELHGGRLEFETVAGPRTIVTVRFPGASDE